MLLKQERDITGLFLLSIFLDLIMLKLKSLFIIFVLFGLAACSSQHPNEVVLGNGILFHLDAGEAQASETDEMDFSGYQSIFEHHPELQVPLYKTIYGEDYQIFIGIAVSITPSKLFSILTADSSLQCVASEKISDTRFKLLAKPHHEHLAINLIQIASGNKFIFCAIGQDSLKIQNFYEKNALFERLSEAH
ncbi:hypothetical protein Ctha_2656 [Chloroherpeton thalassium ATCC 35110]|uniref:Uncharacterized protein n=1 Tax=Chloroherpeton thalassium (strain ATCC 35110 / GB-78) TaxID=517418 RepID=B3QYN2_CHLT3|nr:hypothetical protein [Chloroherpeton thalassium]ACF15105.1 hypothetical protein Ctha_2656 [Chloroherpeton thalassium ATCC 35110]